VDDEGVEEKGAVNGSCETVVFPAESTSCKPGTYRERGDAYIMVHPLGEFEWR
jgi:hypothetical protein